MGRRDAQGAVQIGWFEALVVFPLFVIPWTLLRAIGLIVRATLRSIQRVWRERDRTPGPARPMGIVFSGAAIVMALAVVAIVDHTDNWRDRVEATGLFCITLATLMISPELLGLSALRKLDRWWEASDLPAYQVAFAFYGRRLAHFARRAGFRLGGGLVFASLVVYGIGRLFPADIRGALIAVLPGVAWTTIALLLVGLTGVALQIWLGRTPAAQESPQLLTIGEAERLLADPERHAIVRRWAAALFATGTTLSFIAVTVLGAR